MEDVFEVARNGKISKRSPRYNTDYCNYTYTIMGKDIDGNSLKIVFTLSDNKEVKLITGYRGRIR